MEKNKMVLLSKNVSYNIRFCIRNQYSDYLPDFDLLRIGKTYYIDRKEFKLGIIGFQFILIYFLDKNCPCCNGTGICEGEHRDDILPCLTCNGSGYLM